MTRSDRVRRIEYDPRVRIHDVCDETTLYIAGSQAMQGWERGLMEESARVLCSFGSNFLEVGLGLGFSALSISSNAGTRKHVVIEKHQDVIDLFHASHPRVPKTLQIVHADFFDVVFELPPGELDGILFDPALPMEMWRDDDLWQEVMPLVVRALRSGGAFVPFFSTLPALREQYWPHFDTVIVRRRNFTAYRGTTYTHGRTGYAFIQCFVKGSK